MKLEQLLQRLSYNELSSIAAGETGDGVIQPRRMGMVIDAINTALVDLFSRIPLSEKELIVETLDWKSNYLLDSKHALTTGGTEMKWIIDSPTYPFKDDIVKILAVHNEVGHELPLNDAQQWASAFVPTHNVLQLTHPGANQAVTVMYQALHPKILTEAEVGTGFLAQQIDVPALIEDLLRARIAQAVFGGLGTDNAILRHQTYLTYVENRFNELKATTSLTDTGIDTNVKLELRGYP